jgi:CPA2 family monovalent cation:H+ antiporter-2
LHAEPLLFDLVVLLSASLPVVFLCHRLSLPAVVGFLLTGLVIGPSALGFVDSLDRVSTLAEIGVVLLLFTIGIEFSLERLAKISRVLIGAGGLQVGSTVIVTTVLAQFVGLDLGPSIVVGFIVALSSTAVSLAVLEDRGELDSPHGGLMLAVLLFQDLCVLPMLLVLPLVAGGGEATLKDIFSQMAIAIVVVAVVVYSAKTVLPLLMRQILRLRSRELFIGMVVVVCFGTAWLTAQLGLSLAIGAFLAGLLISESDYSHQVVAEILPLRDLFSSVFFVSIGMLLDLDFLLSNLLYVCMLTGIVLLLKTVLTGVAVMPFRASPRLAILVGLGLAQVGEFSFVLAGESVRLGALDETQYQLVLAISVLTMLVSPLASSAGSALLEAREIPGFSFGGSGRGTPADKGHVVIVGYGVNGRNLTRVLGGAGLPYRVIDLDADAVEQARAQGEPIIYGDATRGKVLGHVHAEAAAVVVITISDPAAARRIVSLVRDMNPTASIVVRTRYVSEIEDLTRVGADEVIPDEFETSVELFARVLERLHIPRNVITAQVDVVRAEQYAMLRGLGTSKQYVESLYELFTAATTITFLIRETSPGVGRSLGDLALGEETGAVVLDVVRKGRAFSDVGASFTLERGDILVLLGNHAELAAARDRLEPPTSATGPSDESSA